MPSSGATERAVQPQALEIHEQELRPGWRAALERVDDAKCGVVRRVRGVRVHRTPGLELLVRTRGDFEERGIELLVPGARGQVERVLTVIGLIDDELVIVQ